MASPKRALKGKIAIITGSSSGLGEDIAKTFAKEGANVSITGRNKEALDKVAAACKAWGAQVAVTVGDITSDDVRKQILKNTLDKFGKIDILVNNAGGGNFNVKIDECNFDDFDRTIDISLRSAYVMTAYVIPHLIKTKGNIVNISGVGSLRPFDGASAINIAKAGVDMLTKCSALELAPHNVRVNGVQPGAYATNFIRGLTDEQKKETFATLGKLHALQRPGEPSELSSYVVYIASDAASFMTGPTTHLNGAFSINTPPPK